MLTAAAVAFAVAVVSVICWFLVQGKLYDEIDSKLGSQAKGSIPSQSVTITLNNCSQTPSSNSGLGDQPSVYYLQLVRSDGTVCLATGSGGLMKATSSDTKVATNPVPRVETYRNGTDSEGNPVRIITVPIVTDHGPRIYPDTALMIGYPLKDTQNTLNELALLLLGVSGIGVIGAGAAGLWIARAGLKPVDRLTEAVEHVARTEDLTLQIPVEGEDEIARLSMSFNSMTAALGESRERQAQLIADAGHELRTPLTSLRTNVELLARSEETGRAIPPADRKALMASVKAQMTELAALIGDLQELSRPDAAIGGPLQVVALHDITAAALERARLRGPELTITHTVAPWYVRAEPAALERAIVNVLDNAVKFSPPQGTIEVTLTDGELTVRDHGSGIPPEDLPHVFERFWRSPTARSLPGSGLGLSIVARTIQQSGGSISLHEAPGGGTEARIRIPGAPTPPPQEAL
ncbi:sensor histidine kinase [Streptomyces beijiangensis]|uniref:histidine kinase n=1 Tax=Streptomyces beijiangensis TaxID=163361 RepID=A0A939JHZ9_9ACTN|nr:HAMP domain-containing sensor histidine kinase [Streptomyces beijiangensis]MBO0512645.1 HAMP domain-containing histidine kinase [Streptomyces beijiangensis]